MNTNVEINQKYSLRIKRIINTTNISLMTLIEILVFKDKKKKVFSVD